MIMERVSTTADAGLLAHMWGSTGGTPALTRKGKPFLTERPRLSVFEDVTYLEQCLERIMIQMQDLAERRREEEVPEVFELQASEVRQVMARVQATEPARFYFVADEDDEDLET